MCTNKRHISMVQHAVQLMFSIPSSNINTDLFNDYDMVIDNKLINS